MNFDELNLNDNVIDALYDMRFEKCTPIQEKCIPEILNGRDVLGVAQTGTGKTAAYLLPILSKLDDGGYPNDAINCVIMSPTRELAQQIDQAMQGFGYYLGTVSSVAVYGGNDGNRYDQELKSLRLGADVIIATPGRLISHISMGNVDFRKVSFFVLDEADRMLDMGFSDDIKTIAKKLPKTCQTIMFSATMPDKIEELAKTLLKNPIEIKLSVSKPAEKIKQSAYICYETQKIGIVKSIFKNKDLNRVIIFSGKKQKVKLINQSLIRMGINSGEMHSDLDQAQRDEVMFKFKSGAVDVLVATDILSRGIDIDDISMVINYDVPHDSEDYVHRIGRTARANRDGRAITFVSKEDISYFQQIEKFLEKEIEKSPLPDGIGDSPDYSSKEKLTNNRTSDKKYKSNKGNYKSSNKRDSRQPSETSSKGNESSVKVRNDSDRRVKHKENTENRKQARNQKRSPKTYNNNKNTDDKKQTSTNASSENKNVNNASVAKNKYKNNSPKYKAKKDYNKSPNTTPQSQSKSDAKKSGISSILKNPLKWIKSIRKK